MQREARRRKQRAAVRADGDFFWADELRPRVAHTVSVAPGAAVRHRRHLSRRHLNPPDLVVEVRNKQRAAVWADGKAIWVVELRRVAHAIRVALVAASSDRCHSASRQLHAPDLVVALVCYKQRAAF